MSRALLAAVIVAVIAFTAAPASAVTIGLADQKPSMFLDPRFQALHVQTVRVFVPWDIRTDSGHRDEIDKWLRLAHAQGKDVLVTWDRSWIPSRKKLDPRPDQFARELQAFRQAHPFVKNFATWNEANINKQPRLVARWWLALRRGCPTCRILGADLLDRGNVLSWAKRFTKAARLKPRYWGLHSYEDANRFTTKRMRELLRAIPGRFWITETGGVVRRARVTGGTWTGRGPQHAARATRWLLTRIVGVSPRIERVYIYHWSVRPQDRTWDSALIGSDDRERPALNVVRQLLGGQR
jgi:hypothetical protein